MANDNAQALFDNVGIMLAASLEYLERAHNERAMREAAEREWPSEVIEDVLDADTVQERTYFKPNPILGLTNIV